MPPTAPFGAPLVGQTEKALNALLVRQLAATSLTQPQWVALTLALAGGGDAVGHEELERRVADALRLEREGAQAHVAALAARGFLHRDGSLVEVTAAGLELHGRIRSAVSAITQRLWGDLPAEDLGAAGRVLATVLARADAELAET